MVAEYIYEDEGFRKEKERQIVEEGRSLWNLKKQEERDLLFRDVDELKQLQRLKMFGRPGHGAPTGDIRKKKFTEHQLGPALRRSQSVFSLEDKEKFIRRPYSDDMNIDPRDALNFGRGGHGAPLRTKSGRLKSTMIGNPEIRFQANESVQRSISNSIRYAADKQEKSEYHNQLEQQIRDRQDQLSRQKEDNFSMTKLMQEIEGTQWGRPGPGGTYWRPSAITGQGFYDKMGWMTADDPRKRQPGIKAGEAEAIKVEMSELARKRNNEHREIMSEIGTELAPLLGSAVTGKPRKDPETGYMMNHGLGTTDVTRLAVKGHQPNSVNSVKGVYNTQLRGQVVEREEGQMRERERDTAQQSQHFQSWDTFWGRPGYGAPRDSTQRENLMKNLYFAENKKAPGNMELITLERLPVKF